MKDRTFYKKATSYKEVIGDFYLSTKRFTETGVYKLWEDEQAFCTLFVDEEKNGQINKILFQGTPLDAKDYKISLTREENGIISNFVKEGFYEPSIYTGFVENGKGQVEFLDAKAVNKGIDECMQSMERINLNTMDLSPEIIDCTADDQQSQ